MSVKENQEQHQVLFVDDDGEFLETVRDLFDVLSEKSWHIQTANSTDAALKILKSGKIDLVAVDVNMPVLDGVQFTGMIHRRYPGLKKVVLTSEATEEKRAASLAAGAELFIEKPHSPEGMQSVFVMLGELLNWKPRDGFQGVLRSVGLQDVIQMECIGRNSSILEIYNEQTLGRIYIEDGHIIHAACGELFGPRALEKLLSLPGGSFELVPFESPQERTLNAPWELLLAEAARKVEVVAPKLEIQKTDSATGEPTAFIEETLICAGAGEPLYDAGCADAPARRTWLLSVAQQAALLDQILPLGHFDRLEMQFDDGRAVAQARADRLIYVRVSNLATKTAAAASA